MVEDEEEGETESTALLAPSTSRGSGYKSIGYPERRWSASKSTWYKIRESIASTWSHVKHPGSWDIQNIAKGSVGAFSAVFLGVLLNLLDALSYGNADFFIRSKPKLTVPRNDLIPSGRVNL